MTYVDIDLKFVSTDEQRVSGSFIATSDRGELLGSETFLLEPNSELIFEYLPALGYSFRLEHD